MFLSYHGLIVGELRLLLVWNNCGNACLLNMKKQSQYYGLMIMVIQRIQKLNKYMYVCITRPLPFLLVAIHNGNRNKDAI